MSAWRCSASSTWPTACRAACGWTRASKWLACSRPTAPSTPSSSPAEARSLLTSADVASLADSSHASILVSLSCSTNRFDVPGFDSLGEVLIRQEQGGAVAVWAPAGLTAFGQAAVLGQLFLERAFDSGEERLGDAVLGALREYAGAPDSERLLRAFNLLGDPALLLPR